MRGRDSRVCQSGMCFLNDSLAMQPDTYFNLRFSPLALCPCYSKLSQRMLFADFATPEIGMGRAVVASPPYQHLHAMHTSFLFKPD
ncbi:hypothetical protein K443DRAFT_394658 [Laccaria amethystina LaAM-08-1]|uniref:Uncharacterized protein n=1 Tax=Laccaria amethystina LaAM-08-1 TaxID=1095629 RepID=A0A0C9XIL9_9AGAR|nr:hypothetical protein K443DRAFT_394658 [Laccaria amethystina LaAM-08-1]